MLEKQNALKYRKLVDAKFCDRTVNSAFQKNDERSTSANLPVPRTAYDVNSETFSLKDPNLSSTLYFTPAVDDILNFESKNSSWNTSTFSSHFATRSYILRLRPIQTSSSSSSNLVLEQHQVHSLLRQTTFLRQQAKPHSSTSENIPSCLFDIPLSLRPSPGIIKLHSLFTLTQDILIELETKTQFGFWMLVNLLFLHIIR